MAEKMKQNIILKILDAVRKTAVKGAYSPSLKGMFEKEVPGKLRGGVEEQRIDDPFNNCLWFGAIVYIAMVAAIASVSMSSSAGKTEDESFSIPDMAFGEDFTIKYVEAQDILFGIEKYPYSEKEEQFVHAFLRGFYKACCDMRLSSEVPIEPAGSVISVSKPFALYHMDQNGNYYQNPDRFCCIFIVDGHAVGEFYVSGVNTGNSSYSAGYEERMVRSLDARIGLKESAKMAAIYPADGTAPYAEVFDKTGEDTDSGVWFSFVIEK